MKILNIGNRVMNTWVYPSPAGYVMIDTGYPGQIRTAEKRLKRYGLGWQDIRYVFLTHAHDDHAGFLNELLGKNPHIRVILNPESLPVLRRGQNSFRGGCSTLSAFLFCKCMALWGKGKHLFPPVSEEFDNRLILISDNSRKELEALLGGIILFTPGHTNDSISLKVGNVIFPGDAAMNGFPSRHRVTIWVEDPAQFGRSWDVLSAENANILYPAHGKPFPKEDLRKNQTFISRIRLYPLKES